MKKIKSEQFGRSMVEMLGVLAIIGVLSVGGIAGYSKAMAKFKYQKGLDQLQTLYSNVMQLFLNQGHLNGLDNVSAIRSGIVPAEMLNGKPATMATEIYNVFNTWVEFDSVSIMFNLPDISSCVYFATAGWGDICYGISGAGDYYIPRSERPLSTVRAHQICKEQKDNAGVYITLFYERGDCPDS